MRRNICLFRLNCGLTLLILCLASAAQAAHENDSIPALDGIPGPMHWQNQPAHWEIEGRQTLSITAGKQTDWFVSPMGDGRRNNSPRLLFKPADDFVFSSKLTVGFRSQWDSGALVIYVNDSLWAKLCFESTIEKRTAIVSVVTRELSDDNNSITLSGPSVYLKIARAGQAIFFYASQDGQNWSIIRAFSLGKTTPDLQVGFSSQSPLGEVCTTLFSDIQYTPKRVNLWTGK